MGFISNLLSNSTSSQPNQIQAREPPRLLRRRSSRTKQGRRASFAEPLPPLPLLGERSPPFYSFAPSDAGSASTDTQEIMASNSQGQAYFAGEQEYRNQPQQAQQPPRAYGDDQQQQRGSYSAQSFSQSARNSASMSYDEGDRDSRPHSASHGGPPRRDRQNGEGSYPLNSSQNGHANPPRGQSPSNSSSNAISQSTHPTTSRSFNNSPLANSSNNPRLPDPQTDSFSSDIGHRSQASASTVRGPPTSLPGGEPLHDMDRAVNLLKGSKFYAEGFLMKRVEVGADGKAVSSLLAQHRYEY